MFTMKKFATLAMTGFLACSILACGDDPECEDGDDSCNESSSSGGGGTSSPSSGGDFWTLGDLTGSGWAKKATITLGGTGATEGSFLDIDALLTSNDPQRFTVGQASANKNKIDLIYDGINFFTPTGCGQDATCPANFKTAVSGAVGEDVPSRLFSSPSLTAGMTPTEASRVFFTDDGLALKPGVEAKGSLSVAPKGIYYIETTKQWYAIILVGEKKGTGNKLTLDVILGYDTF